MRCGRSPRRRGCGSSPCCVTANSPSPISPRSSGSRSRACRATSTARRRRPRHQTPRGHLGVLPDRRRRRRHFALLTSALATVDPTDPVIAADLERLDIVRAPQGRRRQRVLRTDRSDLGRGTIAARRRGHRRGSDSRRDRRPPARSRARRRHRNGPDAATPGRPCRRCRRSRRQPLDAVGGPRQPRTAAACRGGNSARATCTARRWSGVVRSRGDPPGAALPRRPRPGTRRGGSARRAERPAARRRLRPAPPRLPPRRRPSAPRFHPRSSPRLVRPGRVRLLRPSSTSIPPPATTDSPSPSGSPRNRRTIKKIA